MCKKICISLLWFLCGLTVLAGCDLPTYNLSNQETPSQTFAEFMDAVINGDNTKIKNMVYNYSWDSEYLSNVVSSSDVSESDAEIIKCITQSRSYEIVSESDYDNNSRRASVTVNYTTFDVSAFQQKLSEEVLAVIKKKQYEGVVFEDASDTVDIIEENKQKLLQTPENFYTTKKYTVEMISHNGCWQVVISDEFYKALSGYSI